MPKITKRGNSLIETKNTYARPFRRKVAAVPESDPRAHNGPLKYAIDFGVKEGTEIIAAAPGKVIAVKVDSAEGGLKKKT